MATLSDAPPRHPPAPLADVLVLDLSRVLAGPYCTQVLADLGADVIKLERPGTGDETRTWGPPWAGGESAYFLSVNRAKRSVALDLAEPAGRELALELAARAHVVVENFRPGGATRLGVGEADVRERNPRVVWCTISGFGDERPGYDLIAQAETGVMAITGPPEGPPSKVGVAVVDVLAGLNAAAAVLAALRTGQGERVEVSLRDAGLAGLVNVAQGALVTGQEPARLGNAHPSIVPYEPFRAADGWIVVAAANDGQWRRLCGVLGVPEWGEDPRWATNPARVAGRLELVPLLAERFGSRPVAGWEAALRAAGVPAGRIRGVREALDSAAGATVEVVHATAGTLPLVRPAFRLAGREGTPPPTAPPRLGEHTAAVLAELGVARDEVDALIGAGVAASPPSP